MVKSVICHVWVDGEFAEWFVEFLGRQVVKESLTRSEGDSILAEFLHGPLNKTVTPNSQRKTQEDHRKFCQYVYF